MVQANTPLFLEVTKVSKGLKVACPEGCGKVVQILYTDNNKRVFRIELDKGGETVYLASECALR